MSSTRIRSESTPASLFGLAVAAFLVFAVLIGAQETQPASNAALIGTAPVHSFTSS